MSQVHREEDLIRAAKRLRDSVNALSFRDPVAVVYNPLDYAWSAHERYLRAYGQGRKKVVFLGMNPGPFGMAQNGVPFGEIDAVKDWMGIEAEIAKPSQEHPKRPIEGFACRRSEVSGRRLWNLFRARFGAASRFFADHFVANYCPLVFMRDTGANLTPDKLSANERQQLFRLCDEHLGEVVSALQPRWLIGVGRFAAERALRTSEDERIRVGQILHPSPASPAANRDWAGTATRQLRELGIWS